MAKFSTKGIYLEYLLVIYNVIQAVVAIRFASINANIFLIAFGLNSLSDVVLALVYIAPFEKLKLPSKLNPQRKIKQINVFLLINGFFGIYLLFESFKILISNYKFTPSIASIFIALTAITILPIFAFNQSQLGKQAQDKRLIQQGRKTLINSWIPIVMIFGILSNYWFTFWQAGALFGLIIVFNLFKKGLEIWSLTEPVDTWQESDEEEAQV